MRQVVIKKVSLALLSMQRYSWEQGVAAQAFLELGETETAILLARDAVQRQGDDGRLAILRDNDGVTDPAANGEAVLIAARITGEPALQIAADAMLKYLMQTAPRALDGTLFHVTDAREIWVDSIYMAPPFLAAAGETREALLQLRGFKLRLWDSEHGLYRHIWSEEKNTFIRSAHWGVGNGWAAAGTIRVLRSLPDSMVNEKIDLQQHAREIIDGCLLHQRADGLFHDVVDDSKTFVETNLAQMLAYSIYRGVTDGWLPPAYKNRAERMREAVHAKVDSSGFVQGVCGAPLFDRPGTAPEGQAFFLLMEAARKDCP